MDYTQVPTTVFTPIEYSAVGLTEEAAIAKYGDAAVEVFHSHYQPLEWPAFTNRESNSGYLKVITLKAPDESSATSVGAAMQLRTPHAIYWRTAHCERVLGMHYLGPNAAEVIQGYAVAFRNGMTRADLEETIAVHPSTSEEFLNLNITKRSRVDPKKAGCCG
jgi:pyruvate/2-oxoglutarate dehydrogenase complex dihydrolipoamide dehydrogenase (E3) component